jgi:hypothetical protein
MVPERAPLDWADTQNNLGDALTSVGARESGTANLEEAVAAYRAAPAEWTRDAIPHWHDVASRNLCRLPCRLGAAPQEWVSQDVCKVLPMSMRRAEFEKFVADETEKWGRVVKLSGAKPE